MSNQYNAGGYGGQGNAGYAQPQQTGQTYPQQPAQNGGYGMQPQYTNQQNYAQPAYPAQQQQQPQQPQQPQYPLPPAMNASGNVQSAPATYSAPPTAYGQPQQTLQQQQQMQQTYPQQVQPQGYGQQAQQYAQQQNQYPPTQQQQQAYPSTGMVQQQPPQQQQPNPMQRPVIPDGVRPIDARFMSLTVDGIPANQSVRSSSKLPYGVVLQPLAEAGYELPVVNFSTTGIIRCKSCRAYLNPYVYWIDGGARWKCNLCGIVNECPANYFSPLDQTGKRRDMFERPELYESSFEIVATQEYMKRQPMPPTFVFLIDVSQRSVQSGMLQSVADTVRNTLDELTERYGGRLQVGFITFDSAVHFYSLRPEQKKAQMFVLSDLSDIFLPAPNDLLINLAESRPQVEALLESLPHMHAKTTNVECALGSALEAATHLMASIGGKLLTFLTGLPSIGTGRLQNRENPRLLGTDKEPALLAPATDAYSKRAVLLVKYQISVDLFFFAHEYIDVASLGVLSRYTGGQTYYYSGFHIDTDGDKLMSDLRRNLLRETGWEAVVRLRASNGLRVQSFNGNFLLRPPDLMAVPSLDADKTYVCEIVNTQKPLTGNAVSIQAALLYSTSSGERRIRVHTTNVPVLGTVTELFNAAQQNAIINLVAKTAVDIMSTSCKKARAHIRAACINAIRTYRANAMKGGYQDQLPPNLGALPVMTLGLLKNVAFKGGADVRSDERVRTLNNIRIMGLTQLETYVRPMMLPLHNLDGQQGLMDEKTGYVTLPPEASLTVDSLSSDSVFLVDNGMTFFIRLGLQTPQHVLKALFNIETLDHANTAQLALRPADNAADKSLLQRVHNILNYLRSLTPTYQNLVVVKEGDFTEPTFFQQLIEDRTAHQQSLADFSHHVFHGTGY